MPNSIDLTSLSSVNIPLHLIYVIVHRYQPPYLQLMILSLFILIKINNIKYGLRSATILTVYCQTVHFCNNASIYNANVTNSKQISSIKMTAITRVIFPSKYVFYKLSIVFKIVLEFGNIIMLRGIYSYNIL